MKLTATQLKKIIAEEVRRARGGSRLSEGPSEVITQLDALVETLRDAWSGAYDDSDPSMAAGGRDRWIDQVDVAVEELARLLGEAVSDVERRLYDGEFDATGRPTR